MTFKIKYGDDATAEDFIPGLYNNGVISFLIPIVDKDSITLCCDFTTCREVLLDQTRRALKSEEEFCNYKISIRDGYLLLMYGAAKVAHSNTLNVYCANALNLVNLFEKHFDWQESVSFDDIDAYNEFYEDNSSKKRTKKPAAKMRVFDPDKVKLLLVKCSSKWFKSPHMLSLCTLLIRLAMLPELASVKTIKQFKQTITELYDNSSTNRPAWYRRRTDTGYYIENERKIWLLLENFGALIGNSQFRGTYHWQPKTHSYAKRKECTSTIMSEGIVTLCKGTSRAKELSALFAEMCNKNKIPHTVKIPTW